MSASRLGSPEFSPDPDRCTWCFIGEPHSLESHMAFVAIGTEWNERVANNVLPDIRLVLDLRAAHPEGVSATAACLLIAALASQKPPEIEQARQELQRLVEAPKPSTRGGRPA